MKEKDKKGRMNETLTHTVRTIVGERAGASVIGSGSGVGSSSRESDSGSGSGSG